MNKIQESVLDKMQALPTPAQEAVLWFVEQLQQSHVPSSQEMLDAMLLAGLDSGEPIEVTEEWWEQQRIALQQRQPQQ
jgi:hypothetical protein